MGVGSFLDSAEAYEPWEYREDSEIPFAPDGNAPLICNSVEKVKGVTGRFKGLHCIRKTIVAMDIPDQISENIIKRRLAHEVKVLHYARHPHVIQLIHSYFQSGDEGEITLAVIMDRAEGNLHAYLKPGKSPHKHWFGCLVSVLHHIHTLGIRHRDIKPTNILVKGGNILLADFGISQMGLGQTMPTTNLKRNSQRTREYCAPEVEQGRTRGRSADIFSAGAVFLEMLIASPDVKKTEELRVVLQSSSQHNSSYAKSIDEVQRWMDEKLHFVGWRHKILTLCQKMLHADRNQRPTAEELDLSWQSLTNFDESLGCQCAGLVPLSVDNRLADACRSGSAGEVKRLLGDGADPNAVSAIHHASAHGSREVVQVLLNSGVDIEVTNLAGQTPLHCAARSGSEGVVELLIEGGANVNSKDENDQTPLHGAAGHGYARIVQKLLDANADVEAEDQDGDTAFHFAARRDHSVVLGLLENRLRNVE